jgi:hypothetical protein
VGDTTVAEDSAAALPVGRVVSVHLYVSMSLLASVLDAPLKVTVAARTTVWLLPALATGAAFKIDAVTVVANKVLSTLPSFTIKAAT